MAHPGDPGIERGILLNHDGMRHAPENELGVVFLFGKMARQLGFTEVDRIQPRFPDCWAMRRTPSGTKRVWIEFEFRSSGFRTHVRQLRGLRPKRGYVVCWEHNWPECQKHAEIIELRAELGFGRNVWILPTKPEYQGNFESVRPRGKAYWWSMPAVAKVGDLLLMYRAGGNADARKYDEDPDLLQSITHLFRVTSPVRRHAKWKWIADVRPVGKLREPLRLEQMMKDRVLKTAPFIRRNMIGRTRATPWWYRIHELIVRLNPNPALTRALADYDPEKL